MRKLRMAVFALAGLLLVLPATATAEEEPPEPPPALEATTTARFEPAGGDPSLPGRTFIHIKAPSFWHVTVSVSAHGARVLFDEEDVSAGLVSVGEEWGPGPTGTLESVVWWSCKLPGTVYGYVITAVR